MHMCVGWATYMCKLLNCGCAGHVDLHVVEDLDLALELDEVGRVEVDEGEGVAEEDVAALEQVRVPDDHRALCRQTLHKHHEEPWHDIRGERGECGVVYVRESVRESVCESVCVCV